MFLKTMLGCAVVTIACLIPALALAQADPKSDATKLQGTWRLTAVELDKGQPVPMEELQKHPFKLVFVGQKCFELEGKNPATGHLADFTLDPTKSPKQIDIKYVTGPNAKDKTARGIYRLEGDRLTLCLTPPEKSDLPRPATFEGFDPQTRQGGILMTFEREKDPSK